MTNITERYPVEDLTIAAPHAWAADDDGTMPANVESLREAVIGHRIVSVEQDQPITINMWGWDETGLGTIITLDNGKRVVLRDTSDCCAYTQLKDFLLHADRIDHIITGVGTTDGFSTWHIYADMGDVLELQVGWSSGNPFWYGYGFDIAVQDLPAEVAA